jgi:hypothetical protein
MSLSKCQSTYNVWYFLVSIWCKILVCLSNWNVQAVFYDIPVTKILDVKGTNFQCAKKWYGHHYVGWKWCNINFINFRIVGRPGKYTTLFGARQEEVLAFVLEYL